MAAIEDEKVYALKIRESATDGSDFSNPDADYRMLFLGEDGLLHVKDSAGAVANPYSASIASGTGFPGGPSTNDWFFRTDRRLLYFYDGTRWVTVNLYEIPVGISESLLPAAASAGMGRVIAPHAGVYDLWLEDFQAAFFVNGGTALSGSHKWVVDLIKEPAGTTVATITIDSGASSVYRDSGQIAIDALLGTTNFTFRILATKTGTPGTLFLMPAFTYRMVG